MYIEPRFMYTLMGCIVFEIKNTILNSLKSNDINTNSIM